MDAGPYWTQVTDRGERDVVCNAPRSVGRFVVLGRNRLLARHSPSIPAGPRRRAGHDRGAKRLQGRCAAPLSKRAGSGGYGRADLPAGAPSQAQRRLPRGADEIRPVGRVRVAGANSWRRPLEAVREPLSAESRLVNLYG